MYIPPQNSEDMLDPEFKIDPRPIEDPYALGVTCEKGTMYPETCSMCKKSKILLVKNYPKLCGFCAQKEQNNESENKIKCHCGSDAHLKSNSLLYNGREYGNGKAYICDRFPLCRGSVGTHSDGRPLGNIPDEETKKLRQQVHAKIDPYWKTGKIARARVYARIAYALGVDVYHTGESDAETCRKVLELDIESL